MLRCFFHSPASLRGKKPPCCDVLFVRLGSGSALQVFSIVSEILFTMWSSVVQACVHCSGLKCWWVSSSVVRTFIYTEFFSKNVMLNFSIFSGGIGFSILVGDVFVGGGGLAIRVLWGTCNTTG